MIELIPQQPKAEDAERLATFNTMLGFFHSYIVENLSQDKNRRVITEQKFQLLAE